MEKYYVVGLKNDQVAQGALSKIADIIRDAFFETSQQAVKNNNRNAKEHWAIIRFESDFLLNDNTEDLYPEYSQILYLNQVAWDTFVEKGIQLKSLKEIDNLPDKELGMFISMPIFK